MDLSVCKKKQKQLAIILDVYMFMISGYNIIIIIIIIDPLYPMLLLILYNTSMY